MNLIDFCHNINSQFGEDGIIEKIFEILSIKNGYCVDVGAGDGTWLSNTKNLLQNGWSGIQIEQDQERFNGLQDLYKDRNDVHCLKEYVEPETLEILLDKCNAPLDFDFMSIDIDNMEYHLWNAMHKYKPKVIVLECNDGFPFNIEFIPKRNSPRGLIMGASAAALFKLGLKKGYKLICFNVINCFFIENSLYNKFHLDHEDFVNLHIAGCRSDGAHVQGWGREEDKTHFKNIITQALHNQPLNQLADTFEILINGGEIKPLCTSQRKVN